ncbi:MAG: YigZ family protein [Rikenellaceae bacterium]
MDSYFTITETAEGLYKEKGSRFISLSFPLESEDDIKPILVELRKKYFDARHHCYAWKLGVDEVRTRTMDDGEPSSTAGKPILGQIVSTGLTNILIVVIRYFGGTKLGVSGLIKAYREAAADVIRNSTIVEKNIEAFFNISFGYETINSVMKVVKELSPNVEKQDFGNLCSMKLSIRRDQEEILTGRLLDIEGVTINK